MKGHGLRLVHSLSPRVNRVRTTRRRRERVRCGEVHRAGAFIAHSRCRPAALPGGAVRDRARRAGERTPPRHERVRSGWEEMLSTVCDETVRVLILGETAGGLLSPADSDRI